MTTPNDNQSKNDTDYDETVPLKHCDKHDLTYMETEGCPECAKEKNQSAG